VHDLIDAKVDWASSKDLAEALGLTSSTVRQDLFHLDLTGVSKRGYDTRQLESVLRRELGTHRLQRLVIVGAGNLGCALALHGDLTQNGFEPCGIFDACEDVVGARVGGLTVAPMSALKSVVRAKRVAIGIIAVPAESAQQVADLLVAAGVKGLLNLAYVHVKVPRGVSVVDARLLGSLQQLSYAVHSRKRRPRKDR